MIAQTEAIRQEFLHSQVGKTVNVLFETRHGGGLTEGYTENYTPVKAEGEAVCGEIAQVLIDGVDGDFCTGKIVK